MNGGKNAHCEKIMIFKLCELSENWLKLLEKILLSCQLLENSIYTKKKIPKKRRKSSQDLKNRLVVLYKIVRYQ